jgi:hypothetical protein
MTRRKKSRKIGQIGTRKQDSRPEKPDSGRIKKAPKGQKSGNRNSMMLQDEQSNVNASGTSAKKDKRVGSKKPIPLVVEAKAKKAEVKELPASKKQPSVRLSKVSEPTMTPEQELLQIEQDQVLIDLVERVEDGELLTGKEAKYFNKHMARHEELLEILGIDDKEEDDPMAKLDADQWDDLLD